VKLDHLGDAFDHWKGAVINCTRDQLCELHVVPMRTDEKPWPSGCLRVYAKLLSVGHRRILYPEIRFCRDSRKDYFKEIAQCDCDLFLDPDTGIGRKGKCTEKHIKPEEIQALLPMSSKRILLIFQFRFFVKDPFRRKLEELKGHLPGCYLFAYDAGPVAMVFISRSKQRMLPLYRCISSLLRSVPKRRVVPGRMPK
jgi:hypothetical protein